MESGVKLLLPEFEALETFKQLEEEGVKLLLCKTCLDFYGIGEKIAAGQESDMPSIIQAMHEADKVISLSWARCIVPKTEGRCSCLT